MGKREVIAVTAAVFLAGAALSAAIAYLAHEQRAAERAVEFEGRALRMVAEVYRRANLAVYGLAGARGFFRGSDSVQRMEFRAYVESRDLADEFPGVLGFGFIERVYRSELADFVADQKADDAPDFTVHPESDAAVRYVIAFIDPLEPNRSAQGFDVGSERSRRAAVERAVRTGQPTLTPRIELVQDREKRAGLLYLMPVYRRDAAVDTPQAREAALEGLVYAPIAVDEVFSGIERIAEGMIDFAVYDGQGPRAEALLYHFEGGGPDERAIGASARFERTEMIEVGGRMWTVRVLPTAAFLAGTGLSPGVYTGSAGLTFSAMLALLVWSLARGRARAAAIARTMTAELAQSEVQFRSLVNNIPGASYRCLLDEAWTMIFISDAIESMTGYPAADFIGERPQRTFLSVIDPDDRARLDAYIRRSVARREIYEPTYRLQHADGSIRWVREKGQAFFADPGDAAPKYLEGVIFDVTEQIQAEAALAAEQARLEAFVRHAPAAVAMFDTAVRYMAVSERWLMEYGLTDRKIIGESHYDVFPAMPERWKAIHARCLKGAVERSESDSWRPPGWDHDQVLRWEVRPWYDSFGRVAGIMMFTQDITLDKQMEKALEERNASLSAAMTDLAKAQRQAEAANRSKSEFLANMSHEIRTPLTAILGYTDMLRDAGESTDRRHEIIDTIQRAGQHLLLIINDILDLSKIEAGRMTVEAIETDLLRLLLDIESLMRPRAAVKGVRLETRLTSPLPTRIVSDPTRLRQILMNIVGNAAKFTAEGVITIRAGHEASAEGSLLRIEIEDTGPGMTPEQVTAIFSPFTQGDASMARRYGGTGLGLTISRRLANLMGGSLAIVRSEPGRGTCFVIRLPLKPAPGAETISDLAEAQEAPMADDRSTAVIGGRILLAEDNPVNQRLIAHILRKAGAAVTVANDGHEALEALEKAIRDGEPFDLLVTDMQMPEMDGFTLARTLRRMGSEMPIIALTAQAMAADRQACLDAGCSDYATKPVDKAAFLALCRRWLPGDGQFR